MHALFIADLHLQIGNPGTIALARQFLREIAPNAEQLFILGDLVEYWIGDDADDGSLDAVFDDLLQLSRSGCSISLMYGNRDFLLGRQFAKRVGIRIIHDDTYIFSHAQSKILLMHGDTLCTDDTQYQLMRKQLRSAAWQTEFLRRPIAERIAFASDLRSRSQEHTADKKQNIMDVNEDTVRQVLRQFEVADLLHGHTHKPAQHTVLTEPEPATRWVLGDWHDDHAVYAALDEQGLSLKTFRR